MSETAEEVGPDDEATSFTDEQEDGGGDGAGLVEAQCNGYDVTYHGDPAEKGYPDAVFVDVAFLPGQCFRLHLQPAFDPFPLAEPANHIHQYAAEPVAGRTYQQARYGVADGLQHSDVQGIATEGHEGSSQKGTDEEAKETPGFQIQHLLFQELLHKHFFPSDDIDACVRGMGGDGAALKVVEDVVSRDVSLLRQGLDG